VKLEVDGEIVLTPYYCPHLDPQTRLCTIFEHRLELNPLCTTPETGIRHGFWPAACPYAQGTADYKGPRAATPEEAERYEEPCRTLQGLIRQAAAELWKRPKASIPA
jgi:Fe-S-cluster containining protein